MYKCIQMCVSIYVCVYIYISFYMRNGRCSHPISLLGFGWSDQVSATFQGSKLKCKYMFVGSDIYHCHL